MSVTSPGRSNKLSRFVTIDQLAESYSIPESTLRKWIRDGRLPATKIQHHVRIRVEDAEALIRTFGT